MTRWQLEQWQDRQAEIACDLMTEEEREQEAYYQSDEFRAIVEATPEIEPEHEYEANGFDFVAQPMHEKPMPSDELGDILKREAKS